ncbi:hypothetical protein EYF80_048491 [Liparis tanakae]|uniref:Uncharacterized protein n=1 Tax=Liparis tanakae TaxID=230148 RepID=A0A4Z2FM38_9TELE|nr:hypothetical protein EYF80_048491 [Liparis tanakae]
MAACSSSIRLPKARLALGFVLRRPANPGSRPHRYRQRLTRRAGPSSAAPPGEEASPKEPNKRDASGWFLLICMSLSEELWCPQAANEGLRRADPLVSCETEDTSSSSGQRKPRIGLWLRFFFRFMKSEL